MFNYTIELTGSQAAELAMDRELLHMLSKSETFVYLANKKTYWHAHINQKTGEIDNEADREWCALAAALPETGIDAGIIPAEMVFELVREFSIEQIMRILFAYWRGLNEYGISLIAQKRWEYYDMDVILDYIYFKKTPLQLLYAFAPDGELTFEKANEYVLDGIVDYAPGSVINGVVWR
jgi:hypothetical protein